MKRRDGILIPGLATCVLLSQLVLTLVVIPPWQNPDEPQHVMFASALAKHGTGMLPNAFDDQVEGDIVQSMARHRWWTFYGRPTPSPLPPNFKGIESVEVASIHGPASYYIAAAFLLNRLPTDDVTSRLYFLRTASAVLGLATLWCIWSGTRLLFDSTAASVVVVLAALHPQFAIVSTTASTDAVVNLAGALIWWQTGRLWSSPDDVMAMAAVWGSAIAAAAVARLGALLLVSALIVSVVTVVRGSRSHRSLLRIAFALAAVVGGLGTALILSEYRTPAQRVVAYAMAPVYRALEIKLSALPEPWAFTRAFADSFWFTAGWMRFPGPALVLACVHAATAVAIAGVVISLVRDHPLRTRISTAMMFVAVQLAAVTVAFYFTSVGAQGRYVLPALAPVLALGWIGLRQAMPAVSEPVLATAVVTAAACLSIVSSCWVLLPTYLSTR